MLLVGPADIGATAWRRMVRDAALVPLTENLALPADGGFGDDANRAGLRAMALEWALTRHAAVTGLAALWVHGLVPGAVGWRIDVAVPRGQHPDPPLGATSRNWDWHSDSAACEWADSVAGVAVASTAHASITALRRSDHALVIPAVSVAVRLGACSWETLDAALSGHSRRGPGYDRMVSALLAMRAAIPGPVAALP